MTKRFSISFLAAILAIATSALPASADYTGFVPVPAVAPPFVDPGSCQPGYQACTYTLYTDLNQAIHLYDTVQTGYMQVQNLKSGINRLGNVQDPSSASELRNLLGAKNGAAPTNQALAMAQQLGGNSNNAQSDIQNLLGAMQNNGDGALAAAQIQDVVLQKIAGSMEEQNQMQAAAMTQTQANIAQAYHNADAEFDMNGPPTMGWAL